MRSKFPGKWEVIQVHLPWRIYASGNDSATNTIFPHYPEENARTNSNTRKNASMKRRTNKGVLRSGASIVVFGALAFTAQAHAQSAATAAKSDDTVVVVTGQRAALKSAQK